MLAVVLVTAPDSWPEAEFRTSEDSNCAVLEGGHEARRRDDPNREEDREDDRDPRTFESADRPKHELRLTS